MAEKTLEERLQEVYEEKATEFTSALTDYYEKVDNFNFNVKKGATFLDYTAAAYTLVPETVKGLSTAVVDFFSTMSNLLGSTFDSASNVYSSLAKGQFEEAGRDLVFGYANIPITLVEGFTNSFLQIGSTLATLGQGLARDDVNKALLGSLSNFFKQQQLNVANVAQATRAGILGEEGAFNALFSNMPTVDAIMNPQFTSFNPDGSINFQNLAKQGERYQEGVEQQQRNKEAIQSQFNEVNYGELFGADYTFEDFTKDNVWLRDEIVKRLDDSIDRLLLAKGAQVRAQEAFGDSQLYETLRSTATSIGNIAAMLLMAKAVKSTGGKVTPQQVSASTKLFYASQIAGRSYAEAINEGADIQDAFTYALGIAATETAIEQVGGLKFDNLLINKNILKTMLEEGSEELIAEFAQPGLNMYMTGEQQQLDAGEILTNGLYAAMSGALASATIGVSQSVVLDATVNNRAAKISERFMKNAEKYGDEYAIENFKAEVEALVKKLNGKRVLGQVFDDKGNMNIKNMTQQEKQRFINNSLLIPFVKVDANGNFTVIKEALDRISTDNFVNKDADGNVIDDSEWAINDAVKGVQLDDNNPDVKPLKVSELNKNQKLIYDMAKRLNVPIIIARYTDLKNKGILTDGFYGNNGVLYITDKLANNTNPQQIGLRILKHEAIHELRSRDPEAYKQLESSLENIVEISFDKDTLKPVLTFSDKDIEDAFGQELRDDIERAFADLALNQNATGEQIVAAIKEELSAYFAEKVITDAALLEVVEEKTPALFERIKRMMGFGQSMVNLEGDNYEIKNRAAINLLNMYAKSWRQATQKIQENRRSLAVLLDRVFGDEIGAYKVFTKEAISKYGLKTIENAITKTFDVDNNTIEINGETIQMDSILNKDANWVNDLTPKRVSVMTDQEIRDNFKYDNDKEKEYRRDLKRYYNKLDDTIAGLEKGDPERAEIRRKLGIIEKFYDIFEENKSRRNLNKRLVVPEYNLDVLIEAILYGRAMKKPTPAQTQKTLEKTAEGKVLARTVTRAVRELTKGSAFKDFKNGALKYGAAYYSEQLESEERAKEVVNVLNFWIQNYSGARNLYLLRDNYKADYVYEADTKIATILVSPTQSYLEQEIQKEEALVNQKENQEEQEQLENKDLTNEQRKELQKYYTSKEMANNVFNNVVATLEKFNIDINDLTIIESSAGAGAFLEVFNEFNPNLNVLAYDVEPESPLVSSQDFLQLDKEFDQNSIVIGNPPFKNNLDSQFINKSLEISPAVAFILPGTWANSARKHRLVGDKYKLVINEFLGIETFKFNDQQVPVKTVLQMWVNPEAETRYKKATDLRRIEPNPKKSPYFEHFTLSGVVEDYQNLKKEVEAGFDFDFAVHSDGNYKSYNEKITDIDKITPKSKYIVVKARSETAKKVLNEIDYDELSFKGSTIRRGFTLYDLIEEVDKKIVLKRTQRKADSNENVSTDSENFVLSQEQIEFFKNSKIRNQEGKLQRLYHGSLSENISEFSPDFAGQATGVPEKIIYFTNNYDTAVDFSAEKMPTYSQFVEEKTGKYGVVYETYLNIQNPLDLRNMTAQDEALLERLISEKFGIIGDKGRQWVESVKSNHQLAKTVLNDEVLKENGYDGLIAEMYVNSGVFEYGIIEPNQVKSTNNLAPQDTNDIYDGDIVLKRTSSGKQLNEQQREQIRKVFDDEFIGFYFDVDKNGNFVPKSKYIGRKYKKANKIKIKYYDEKGNIVENELRNSEYIINFDLETDDVLDVTNLTDNSGNELRFRFVKQQDLGADEKAVFEVLRSLGIRFVGYEATLANQNKTLGFSIPNTKNDLTFINLKYLTSNPSSIFEVLVHEYTHEIFSSNQKVLTDSLKWFLEIMFDPSGNPKPEFQDIFKLSNAGIPSSKEFVSYMKNAYGFKMIKSEQDIFKLLSLAYKGMINKNIDPALNEVVDEVIAQLYGFIFSSRTYINKYFSPKDVRSYNLYRVYDLIIKKNNSLPVQQLIEKHSKAFYNAHLAHQKYMRSLFPDKGEKISGTTINSFINKFSDGQFKTRAELSNAYLEDVRKGRRGVATDVFNNILYLSSKFGNSIGKGLKQYQAISQEFKNTLEILNMLIQNRQDSAYLTKDGIVKEFNQLEKLIISPATKFIKDTANGNTTNVFNAFNSYEYLDRIEEAVSDFVENYIEIDERILKAFDLPLHADMVTYLDNVIKNLDSMNKTIADYRANKISEDEFINQLKPDVALLYGLTKGIEQVKNVGSKTYSSLNNINTIQSEVLKRDAAIFYRDLKKAVTNAQKKITSVAKTKQSGLNFELQNAFDILNETLNLVKSNQANLKTLQREMLGKIRELESVMLQSERILNIYGELDDKGQVDIRKTQDILKEQFMYYIYGTYGAIYDVSDILEVEFPNLKQIKGQTLQELGFKNSYYNFGKFIQRYLDALQTRYTTVFSDDQLEHQEYAEQETKAIIKMKSDKTNNHLKLLNNGFFADIMLRQDVLQMYADTFGRDNVDFFAKFWEIYYDATLRAEEIVADYDRESTEFLKNNPKILEWEKEEVLLPEGSFYNLPQSEFDDVRTKVEEEYNTFQEEIREQQKELKELKDDWTKAKKVVSKLRTDLRALSSKTTQKYLSLQKALSTANLIAKEARENWKLFKESLENKKALMLPKNLLLKQRVLELANEKGYKPPTVTKGELISLYQSIVREQEMHEQDTDTLGPDDTVLKPTEHFNIGGGFNRFDSDLARRKGYEKAKKLAKSDIYTQMLDRTELIAAFEEIIKQEDNYQIALDFGNDRFNKNYELVNEVYKKIFQKNMAKQQTYIPFRTIDSDWAREFDRKLANRHNVGVADGFTLETTIGANTPLAIQNYFSVITGSTTATSKYSYERLIKDYQNLKVTNVDNINNFSRALNYIDQGAFDSFFEKTFVDILGYGSGDGVEWEKYVNSVLNNSVAATMALNLPSFLKQYISIVTIALRNKIDIAKMSKNLAIHGIPFTMTEHRKWLIENNSNFYFRQKINGILALSEAQNNGEGLAALQSATGKVKDVLGAPVGWSDSSVLVAAFATIAEKIQEQNPNMTQEEVFEKANDEFNRTVMLSGVANTNTAFRARYSTNKNTISRIISRFQSESILQISYFIRQMIMAAKGFKDAEPFRAGASLVASGAISGLISALFARLRGFTEDDEEMLKDFFYNEFILQNLIGTIPYVNAIINTFQFDVKNENLRLNRVFDVRMPLLSEVQDVFELSLKTYYNLRDGKSPTKNLIRLGETVGQMTGLPVRNTFRLTEYITKINSDASIAFEEFYYSRTSAELLNNAIKQGSSPKVQNYIARSITNSAVKNELTELVLRTEDAELNLRQYETFKAKNPITDEMIEYKIPQRTNEKYKLLTQRALQLLIRSAGYRRLPDEEKIKAVQRVFNYYYEFMKNEILVKEYAKLSGAEKREIDYDKMRKKTILDVNRVVENAIRG